MFSFFKKKPADAEPAPATGERPRSALEWLNADVGELLFGKKDGAAPMPDPGTSAPVVAPDPTLPAAASASIAAPAQPTAPSSPEPRDDDRRDWLARLRTGLRRTGSSIADVFVGATIDEAMYEDLEAALLQADAGSAATAFLLEDLQGRVRRADLRNPAAVRRLLAEALADLLGPLEKALVIGEHSPTVIMVVGVNGAGKTTSVGKLARHLMDADQKVLLAAADTFRAAAREQLLAWAERADPACTRRRPRRAPRAMRSGSRSSARKAATRPASRSTPWSPARRAAAMSSSPTRPAAWRPSRT